MRMFNCISLVNKDWRVCCRYYRYIIQKKQEASITEALQTHTTGATSYISPMHSQNKIYTVLVLLYPFTLLIHSPTTFREPLSNNPISPSSGFFPSPSDTSPNPNAAVVATSPDATVYVHRPDRRAFALFLPSGEEYYIIHPTQSVRDSTTCSRL